MGDFPRLTQHGFVAKCCASNPEHCTTCYFWSSLCLLCLCSACDAPHVWGGQLLVSAVFRAAILCPVGHSMSANAPPHSPIPPYLVCL